ncbi:hypothetical protein OG455_23505 [Kitasatospora sp. NBC_01287]|uniref:hypothetical protein n=1 Tax=Kitasatospora sp. NBC_01287 TaxID=2903573 RepID=UPI002252FA3B|nr:hypothetical protein [Kitasatospora sp. NBC_01287]MCX4748444.1 hypothetical protein [Kitasatospora sp. NBC_01287]
MRRTAGAAVAAVVLAAALAACGGGGGLRPAVGATPSPSAASPSPSASKPADRSPQGVLLSAEQVLQTARRAKLSYRFDNPDGTSDSADGVLYWAPRTIMQLARTNPGATDQLIVMDTVSYQGGDAATAARLGGKHWEKTGEVTGPDGKPETPFAPLVDQLNPLQAVTAAAAAADLQKVGEETVGDGTAEHYTATVPVADYVAAQQNLLSADRRSRLAAALGQGGVGTLTLDLWLNDKDQLVQLQRSGTGSKGDLEQVIQYSEFGGQLAVTAPAEDDTQDLSGS